MYSENIGKFHQNVYNNITAINYDLITDSFTTATLLALLLGEKVKDER